tara:strand:- start:479 stop:649 length:171 start_codon:yes stop_codon:yes gene_type:complete
MKYGFYKFEGYKSPVNWCLYLKKYNNKRSETLDYVYFYDINDLKKYCENNQIIILK